MVAALGLMLGTSAGITFGGVALTTATGALTLAGSLVNIGGSLLLSAAAKALAPGPAPADMQVNSKAATAPRVGHVGIVKAGGNVVFHRAKDGTSWRVVVHGHGAIHEVLGQYLNNVPVTLDGSGWVTDAQYVYKGTSRVRLLSRLGDVPAAVYSDLTAIWPEWTVDHRLDGQWTSLIRADAVPAESFPAVYPNGEPDLFLRAKTARFLDPRVNATVFTENAALIIAGYVGLADGFNRPDAVDADDLMAEADLADQDMPLAAGGTEKRFRLGGSYLLSEPPQDVLRRMLDATGGRVRLRPNGKIGLRLGAWRAPRLTLTFDMLSGAAQDFEFGPDKLDRFNVLPGRYVDPGLDFMEVDAEAWRDEARIRADGEELVGPARSLLMAPSHRQARQVLKILTARENPPRRLQLDLKPGALEAAYEDEVTVDMPEIGVTGTFEVTAPTVRIERGLLAGVSLVLTEISADAFTLSLDDQGAQQVLPEPDEPSEVPVPVIVAAAPAGVQTTQTGWIAGIGVAWNAPPSDALTPVVRWSVAGADEWVDWPVGPDATQTVISGVLEDGATYDVAVHFLTPGGVLGVADVAAGVVAEAISAAPAAPTSLAVEDLTGGLARVTVIASVTEGLWKTEVYRNAVLVGDLRSEPGAGLAFVDTCGAGSFTWTAVAVNVSAKASAPTAGVVQVIT